MIEESIFENIIKYPIANRFLYRGDFFYKLEGRNLKLIHVNESFFERIHLDIWEYRTLNIFNDYYDYMSVCVSRTIPNDYKKLDIYNYLKVQSL